MKIKLGRSEAAAIEELVAALETHAELKNNFRKLSTERSKVYLTYKIAMALGVPSRVEKLLVTALRAYGAEAEQEEAPEEAPDMSSEEAPEEEL